MTTNPVTEAKIDASNSNSKIRNLKKEQTTSLWQIGVLSLISTKRMKIIITKVRQLKKSFLSPNKNPPINLNKKVLH